MLRNCFSAIRSLLSVLTHSVMIANEPEPRICSRFQFWIEVSSFRNTIDGDVVEPEMLLIVIFNDSQVNRDTTVTTVIY